ncbi:MAG: UPF0175 family protein [Blastocatellia bacterium]|nr:UPF0175 family protein [Blastocatellia bacterium]
MHEVTISISSEALVALKLSPEDAAKTVRLAAAVKLYEIGQLSSGAAAALADIPRTLFLSKLGDFGVATFRQTEEDLREDLANA